MQGARAQIGGKGIDRGSKGMVVPTGFKESACVREVSMVHDSTKLVHIVTDCGGVQSSCITYHAMISLVSHGRANIY